MNEQVKALWIEALESGRFRRTRNALHRTKKSDNKPAGFCCLGVLCVLYNETHPDEPLKVRVAADGTVEYDGRDGYLPPRVMEWSMLDSDAQFTLSMLNDGEDRWDLPGKTPGKTFKQIAKYVRDNL